MLLFAIGTVFLATRPTMPKRAEILWAIAITGITAGPSSCNDSPKIASVADLPMTTRGRDNRSWLV
jgi:hypothetical protein